MSKNNDWEEFRKHLDCEMHKKVLQKKFLLWGAIVALALLNVLTVSVAFDRIRAAEQRITAAENTIALLKLRVSSTKKKR